MADERYWLSIPGSKDPPRGPMDLVAIRSSWNAGSLDAASTMCKVGDSTWVRVDSVFGVPTAPMPSPGAGAPAIDTVVVPAAATVGERREARGDLAARRAALTNGAKSLETNATVFQVLAVVMLVAGVVAMNIPQDSLIFPKWQVVMGIAAAAAPFAFATGLVLRALGEILLALRDGLGK